MAEEEKKTTPPPEPPKEEPKEEGPEFTFTEEEINEGKGVAWLSYFGILVLIPLLTKKENKFCMAHAKQGLALFILEIIMWIICIIPYVGWVLGGILWIIVIVFIIMGMIQAFGGKFKKLPVIGDLAFKMFKF